MIRPEFLTNRPGATLRDALDAAQPTVPRGFAEAPTTLGDIGIATGLVTPAGFAALAARMEQAARTRLLLGAEDAPEAHRIARGEDRRADEMPGPHRRHAVTAALALLDQALRWERDRLPYTALARTQRQRMVALLRGGRIETRRHTEKFLPAKALLLDGLDPGIVVGSSNLTAAGLDGDGALNLAHTGRGVFDQARAWFDALWEEAEPFDLAAIFAEPNVEYPPWLIFMRMLFQLYGEEIAQEIAEVGEIPLTAFQLHGVWRARRILAEYGGVIVADEVGLGKTYIAGEILNAATKARQRALLVCPAALRDTTWKRFLDVHGISRWVDMVSFDDLARDRQLHDERRPLATQHKLRYDVDDYALVVVDEAHNYRNPDAPYRAAALRRLLFGNPRKQLVLLTATPVNNSLWDLYHLMRFFLRQNSALASRGIVDLRERFRAAAKQDPSELNPDFLYPVIDAVTVKRTRGFVKRFYADATIIAADGTHRPIVFPKAVPLSVRYDLDAAAPGLFDAVADALDPATGRNTVRFARYAPDAFRADRDADDDEAAETAAGLLRSGLLKRFESSAHAFRVSLDRMVREHDVFLAALERGRVVTTRFLRELATDEDAFDDLLDSSGDVADAAAYDVPALRDAVARDRGILNALAERVATIDEARDPKLAALVEALAEIAVSARHDAATDADERRNRKVLLFSYFADTVAWLRAALQTHIATDPRLAGYRGRTVAVAGGGLAGEDATRDRAVWGFAPESADPPPGQADLYDLLIATDVLAEGLNLQQCRNIVNYDLPWNPMRLVQRHGRIDRIGSPHRHVFLRTVFPADRLDALLTLEARILRKLSQAARSIGVATLPLHGAEPGVQVFAETRAEIERLAAGDGALFERGGTPGAAQSGEEYRQRLRAALAENRRAIELLPGGAGSGLHRGRATGVLFCAEVALSTEHRSFLRFVPAGPDWRPGDGRIERETATCLRLPDCERDAARAMPPELADTIFAFWNVARENILAEWDDLTDPVHLQPPVRPLNRQVAAWLRAQRFADIAPDKLARALDILESPWPQREETMLRERFRDRSAPPLVRGRLLVDWVLATGLEPARAPAPLPPIGADAVRLVCWMALAASP